MNWLTQLRWSPYVVGAGIGVLSWLTWLVSKKPIGCSTSYARTAGMIERAIRGPKVNEKAYYKEVVPMVDWQWMLVLGMIIGAALSAWLSGDLVLRWVPTLWAKLFGTSVLLRVLGGFVGGVLLGFGARWADGCTSGHGISGTMQLSLASWVSAGSLFIGGIVMARILVALAG